MSIETVPTIIYGGAFNPPTKAHAAIVNGLADVARQENADLWVMPSGERRDKTIRAELAIRTSYIYALLASAETYGVETRIENYELERAELTETYETNRHLEGEHPDRHFTWVFGSDSVNGMRDWYRGAWLLEHMDMIIIERPGFPLTETPRHHRILKLGEMAISSSDVRRRIDDGEEIDSIVPAPVIGVLRQAGAGVL